MAEEKRGRWRPGQSGNVKGRPKGVGTIGQLRESLHPHLPLILKKLVNMALAGDVQACRLVIERVIPTIKPTEQPVTLSLPADAGLTAQGQAVVAAVAEGKLSPGQGAALLGGLAGLARIVEMDEFEKRIARLEGGHAAES